MYKTRKSAGFTLMELMIVVAIIGITAGFSIPYFAGAEHKVRKVALELTSDMQKTRMNAIKTNRDWAILFYPSKNEYKIYDNNWTNGNGKFVETVSFENYSAGVKYKDGSGGGAGPITYGTTNDGALTPHILTFRSNGTILGPLNGYVYISYSNSAYRVGTLTTGIIRVHRWTGGSWQ